MLNLHSSRHLIIIDMHLRSFFILVSFALAPPTVSNKRRSRILKNSHLCRVGVTLYTMIIIVVVLDEKKVGAMMVVYVI